MDTSTVSPSHLLCFVAGAAVTYFLTKNSNHQQIARKKKADDNDFSDNDSSDDDDVPDGVASLLPQELKMVLVVRNDLKMGKGKIGAQCGHATLGCFKRARRQTPDNVASWSRWGQAKICVKVNSEAELLEIEAMAQALNLVNYVVADAGRTQIGAGSLTVLAIGPASKPELDQITGHLKLL